MERNPPLAPSVFWRNLGRTEIQNFKYCASTISILCVPDHGVHPRHSPRTFPLGLLAPRCLGFLLILAISALRSGGEGRRLFGGRKESFPQLRAPPRAFGVRPRTTPFLVFISAVCGVAFATRFRIARLRRRSSFSHGRPSGNVRGSNTSCLPQRVRVRTRFAHPCAHEQHSLYKLQRFNTKIIKFFPQTI